jgi:hypothetical protein
MFILTGNKIFRYEISVDFIILFSIFQTVPATGQNIQKPNKEKLWEQIAPSFSPPEEFRNKLENLRGTHLAGNGPCLPPACTKNLPVPFGPTRALCSTKPGNQKILTIFLFYSMY